MAYTTEQLVLHGAVTVTHQGVWGTEVTHREWDPGVAHGGELRGNAQNGGLASRS